MRFLVLGDIMLDQYTFVRSTRMAEEASIPVWDEVGQEFRLGGAANVANNLKAIGGDDVEVWLAGISRNDATIDLASAARLNTTLCMSGKTMVKHRYVDVSSMSLVHRSDSLREFPKDDVEYFEMMLQGRKLPDFDALVVSDYDKGSITSCVMSCLSKLERRWSVVDSKRLDLSLFNGFDLLKVNHDEYSVQVSMTGHLYERFESLFGTVVVTKGSSGADLSIYDKKRSSSGKHVVHTEHFPTEPSSPVDVTGCGDTHTAAMAFVLAKTGDARAAVRFANQCASKVVQKFGTSTII